MIVVPDTEEQTGEEVLVPSGKREVGINSHDIITTTTVDDFGVVKEIITLALYGDGVYKKETARKHTLTYKMKNTEVISEEKAQSYEDASFTVEVHHKKDETVEITVTVDNRPTTRARHKIAKIF